METFAPKGNIYGPILPQFILQMSITFGAKTMYAILCDYAADKDLHNDPTSYRHWRG